jgi:hypothetical protein
LFPALFFVIMTFAAFIGYSGMPKFVDCGTETTADNLSALGLAAMTFVAPVALIVGLVRLSRRDYSGVIWLLQLLVLLFAWLAAWPHLYCSD